MIIDTLQNAHKYYSVHPLFQPAFEYIAAQNLTAIETGKFDISDGLKVINNTAVGKTAEASVAKFECHNKNIDIQLCIKGDEQMGWKPRSKCVLLKPCLWLNKSVCHLGSLLTPRKWKVLSSPCQIVAISATMSTNP